MIKSISVPIISGIVYLILFAYKKAVGGNERFTRWIPLVACILGMALGVACFYIQSDIMPADNLFSAIMLGGVSGLASTGTDQAVRQLFKKRDKNNPLPDNK